jgi:ABC-type multidrug transport system ATPase subunit
MSAGVSAEPLWQLSGVQIRRGSHAWPETPLTLSIRHGTTAVLGLSGAVKTSLLDLLVGFVQPDTGSIHGPGSRRNSIAWVPQNHGLWIGHAVLDHLTLAGASANDAARLLECFDLAEKAHVQAEALSLGESARLSVARALAQKASVVVMDEPLAHVDSMRAGKYWHVIREHLAHSGAAFVFATHQAEVALAEAANAVCLRAGTVVFQGSMSALYHEPATEELAGFLGPANWLTEKDTQNWLGSKFDGPHCIRPERLVIASDPDGAFAVRSSRFLGSHAEAELLNAAGHVRTFYHRPLMALPIGTRVGVRILPHE